MSHDAWKNWSKRGVARVPHECEAPQEKLSLRGCGVMARRDLLWGGGNEARLRHGCPIVGGSQGPLTYPRVLTVLDR